MKKGTRHFLGRKGQTLFDTNVKMKEMEDVKLVFNSTPILDSGTASVRARPTVKHYIPSPDSFQAFAVPTPTVPAFAPAVNGTKINGSVSDDQSSNGSISVTDPMEGEIYVPAPPSMAPPPPPEVFYLPPPEFFGDLSTLQPPPMPAPKPPLALVSPQEKDSSFFSSPPVSPVSPSSVPERPKFAPPQPPREKSRKSFKNPPIRPHSALVSPQEDLPFLNSQPLSPSSVIERPKFAPPQPPMEKSRMSFKNPPLRPHSAFVSQQEDLPMVNSQPISPTSGIERPKFAPPQPPMEKQRKSFKSPPPKPIRISSVSDVPRDTPTPPPVHTPTLSTFNPQSPAKLYSAPKRTFLGASEERDTKTKSLLLLEDVGAGPVSVQNKPPTKSPTKSVSMYVPEVKNNKPDVPTEVKETETAPKICEPPSIPPPLSTQPEPIRERKPITAATLKEIAKTPKTPPQSSPQPGRISSPDHTTLEKPDATLSGKYSPLLDRKLRNLKTGEPSGPREASPLALLMAAKQRDKNKPGQSHENSIKNEPPLDSSYSSLVNTKSGSSSSLNSQNGPSESPEDVAPSKQIQVNSAVSLPSPPPKTLGATSLSPPSPEPPEAKQNTPDLDTPFLPPPPEFEDLDDIGPPPNPPAEKAPTFTPAPAPPALPAVAPSPPPKLTSPPALQPPPPLLDTGVKAKPPPIQAKPKTAPTPLPTPVTANQATLLNILKKKMQEMDQKMRPDVSEPESNMDDWGSPEDNKVPSLSNTINKSTTLDMRELKTKVAQKNYEPSPNKMSNLPTSNGPSRHQYGMTFTVRPGTKQPITLVSRGES